jgi:predicted nucleic acid-binding protein
VKRYVIDTNVLISFVTDRNPGQQETVAGLFEQATPGKTSILCPQNVLVEFVYVMDKVYRQPKKLVRQMVADFIAMPGTAVGNDVPFGEVLALWPDPFGDLGDALVAAVALRAGKAELVTFDSDFRRAGKGLGIAVWTGGTF